jgi:hypothetical protein
VDKTAIGVVVASLLLCLPCLLVAVGAAGGVVLVSGAAAWLADNALIAVLGVGAALALGAAIIAYRRRCAAACEVEPSLTQGTKVIGSRR